MAIINLATQPTSKNQTGTSFTNANSTTSGVMGYQAKSPFDNVALTNDKLPANQVKTIATPTPKSTDGGTGGIDYTLHPGESINAYNARIAQARGTQTTGTSGATGTTGAGGASGTASAGTNQFTVNNGLFGQLIAALANKSNQPSADYSAAQAEAQKYNQALNQSRMNEAQALSANAQNPIPLEFQQGRGQVLQSQYAQEQAALGSAFQGASNLLGAANTQQGLQQSGLGSAAGFAAPQPYGITTTPFNPATGQYGTMPGGANGAFNAGQVQGNVALGQQYSQVLKPAYDQAGTIKANFQNFLAQNPGINPSTLNLANAAQQWLLGKQVSDPNQQRLTQFLTEFTNTLAPLVGSSGDVTNFKQSLVNGLLSSTASGESLSQAVDSMYKIAGDKLNDILRSGTGGTSSAPSGKTMFGSFFG